MPTITPLPLATYPSGTRNFGPVSLPRGLDGFEVRMGSCTSADPTIWPDPATVVKVDFQFSYDGGTTWTPLGQNSWEQGGGIIVGRNGEVPERIFGWSFSPNQPNAAKATVTVTNGPIRSYLTVTYQT